MSRGTRGERRRNEAGSARDQMLQQAKTRANSSPPGEGKGGAFRSGAGGEAPAPDGKPRRIKR